MSAAGPDPAREPACAVRGMLGERGRVRLVTRNLGIDAEGQTSYATDAAHPSAVDLLVAALVTDVLAGFQRAATRAGVPLDDAALHAVGAA